MEVKSTFFEGKPSRSPSKKIPEIPVPVSAKKGNKLSELWHKTGTSQSSSATHCPRKSQCQHCFCKHSLPWHNIDHSFELNRGRSTENREVDHS